MRPGGVVDRRVVRVLADGLRAHERRELELLHVGALAERGVRGDERPLLLPESFTAGALLRELEVVEGELVERGHVRVVDRERALQVQLRASKSMSSLQPIRLRRLVRVALHLEHREVDERRARSGSCASMTACWSAPIAASSLPSALNW